MAQSWEEFEDRADDTQNMFSKLCLTWKLGHICKAQGSLFHVSSRRVGHEREESGEFAWPIQKLKIIEQTYPHAWRWRYMAMKHNSTHTHSMLHKDKILTLLTLIIFFLFLKLSLVSCSFHEVSCFGRVNHNANHEGDMSSDCGFIIFTVPVHLEESYFRVLLDYQ